MMSKVMINLSMSLDGFIAGPGDCRAHPLGEREGDYLVNWCFSGDTPFEGTMFKPKGTSRDVVAEMVHHAGAMLTGRRTYEIANGWNGNHPVNSMPVVIMTHTPPTDAPKGKSQLVFVTDGIERAVAKAKELANGKEVEIASASVAQQALRAGLVDELYLHVAPILLGEGVRLFEHLGKEAIRLRKLSSVDAEDAIHLLFEVFPD
jgi:dihydrofolate reductase